MAKKIFDGLGPGTLIPQRGQLPLTDPRISAEDGFVLSRVDGRTSLEEICLLVPFDEPVTMVMLRRLWELGAIDVPGVARTIPPPQAPPARPPLDADTGQFERLAASPPPEGLTVEQARRIDEVFAALDRRNAFELLEVPRTADAKEVKRAYFRLSKEFHPDRHYGKPIGEYKDRLSKIFQAVKAAFELLSDEKRRAAYVESLGG